MTRSLPMPSFQTLLADLLVLLAAPLALRAESIEHEFYRRAPEIIQTLKKQKCKNVGVLKFLVQKGDDKPTPIAGTLNLDLANRLAIALILRNHEEPPLGILRDANAVAARLEGASQTSAGRRKLFDAAYPLAWGDEKVVPDAFLTGVARISSDLNKMTVELWLVDRQGELVKDAFKPIEATTRPGNLAEMGESFLLRGLFDRKKKTEKPAPAPDKTIAAIESAQEVQQGKVVHPIADIQEAPVTLEILYAGRKVPLRIEHGRASIEEPMQGQKVVFVIKRNGNPQARYKIVLKVNGLNTIEKERLPDGQCWGWVLDRGVDTLEIKGFQIDDKVSEEFHTVSRAISLAKESYYGQDVGMITLTVFGESQAKEKPKVIFAREAEASNAIEVTHAGVLPDIRVKNKKETDNNPITTIDELQTQLRKQTITRGLIEGGNRVPSQVETVSFQVDRAPIMSAVISYYQPQAR